MSDLIYKLLPELAEYGARKELLGEVPLDILWRGSEDFHLDQGIAYKLELSNTGEGVLLRGSAKASGSTQCARCLEDARFAVEGDVEGYYILKSAADDTTDSDDEFTVIDADGAVDLMVPITAAIIYELPQISLCKEGCAGLCPKCGENLNERDCGCADSTEPEGPFAILKNLSLPE